MLSQRLLGAAASAFLALLLQACGADAEHGPGDVPAGAGHAPTAAVPAAEADTSPAEDAGIAVAERREVERARASIADAYRKASARWSGLYPKLNEATRKSQSTKRIDQALRLVHEGLEDSQVSLRGDRPQEAKASLRGAEDTLRDIDEWIEEALRDIERQRAADDTPPAPEPVNASASRHSRLLPTLAHEQPRPTPSAKPRSMTAQEVFRARSPGVVKFLVYDRLNRLLSQGTGFAVEDGSRIVTNFHVVEGGASIVVETAGGTRLSASSVVAADRARDLAVLSLPAPLATRLALQFAEPEVGSRVYAIGSPKGLSNTLSEGLISGYRRRENGQRIIQTSAPISPGSSGGPLFSTKGGVVGVVYATIVGGQQLNLAIPSADVARILRRKSTPQPLGRPGPRKTLYAAIAWHEQTRRFGWASDATSKYDAELAAKRQAGNGARIVLWASNAWCALAMSHDGAWGVGHGATREIAEARAKLACLQHASSCRIEASFPSDSTMRDR